MRNHKIRAGVNLDPFGSTRVLDMLTHRPETSYKSLTLKSQTPYHIVSLFCLVLPSSRCPPLGSRGSCHRSTGRSHWGSSVCVASHWLQRWSGWRSCREVYRLCAVQLPPGPALFLRPDGQFSWQARARDGDCGGGVHGGGRGGVPHLPSGWLPSCWAGGASPLRSGYSPAQRSWCL